MDTSFLIDIADEDAQKIVGGVGNSYAASSATTTAIEAMNEAASNMAQISAASTTTNVSIGTSTATMNVGKRFSEGLSTVGR